MEVELGASSSSRVRSIRGALGIWISAQSIEEQLFAHIQRLMDVASCAVAIQQIE
jgi:hypothetical protein